MIAAAWEVMPLSDELTARRLIETHLDDMAQNPVGHRPDRVEPRAIKRRPKPHKFLTCPREEARAALLAGQA